MNTEASSTIHSRGDELGHHTMSARYKILSSLSPQLVLIIASSFYLFIVFLLPQVCLPFFVMASLPSLRILLSFGSCHPSRV